MTAAKVAVFAIIGLFFGGIPGLLIAAGVGIYLLEKGGNN